MSRDRLREDRFATLTIPTTGHVPMAAALLIFSLLVATPLLVQAAAARATTGRLAWPRDWVGTAIPGLLHGRFGAGLHAGAAELPRNLSRVKGTAGHGLPADRGIHARSLFASERRLSSGGRRWRGG